MHNPPLFITFEGGEGAGKSTLIRRIQEYFTAQKAKVVVTREPGGTLLGDIVRGLILNKDSHVPLVPKAELFLILAARAMHVEELIRPALAQGSIVLCDRFCDSSIAYQGYARGLGPDLVAGMSAYSTGHLTPDLTFYLDVNPDVGFERMRLSDREQDRIEQETPTFHHQVREGFLEIAKLHPDRVKVLNAHLTPDEVYHQALEYLERLCGSPS
jgi:dTMP kinase